MLPALRIVPGDTAEGMKRVGEFRGTQRGRRPGGDQQTRAAAAKTALRERCRIGLAVLSSPPESSVDICGRSGGTAGSWKSVSTLSSERPEG